MYAPKSRVATEFISHEEIEATLAFAEEHKHDREYIQAALQKAEAFKLLTHREAAVLRACEEQALNN